MKSEILLKKLESQDYLELLDALAFLESQKRANFQLTDELRSRVKRLLYYNYPDKTDPDSLEMEENLRRDAALVLGLYLGDRSALDDLVKLVRENSNSDFVLSSVISGISRIGDYEDQTKRVLSELAQIVLQPQLSQPLKDKAYVEILHILNRLKPNDYVDGLEGKFKFSIDKELLNSLISYIG